jgi:hypothetical protein
VRLLGSITAEARRAAGYRWFNSLPTRQVVDCLANAGVPAGLATAIAGQRPLAQDQPVGLRNETSGSEANEYRLLAAMLKGSGR